MAPVWPRVRAFLEADVAHRARRLAEGGQAALFADLHPAVRWGDGSLEVQVSRHEAVKDLAGRGLLLMPSRSSGTGPARRPRAVAADRLLSGARDRDAVGRGRRGARRPGAGARRHAGPILAALDAPRSTTELAERLGSAPGVSPPPDRPARRRPGERAAARAAPCSSPTPRPTRCSRPPRRPGPRPPRARGAPGGAAPSVAVGSALPAIWHARGGDDGDRADEERARPARDVLGELPSQKRGDRAAGEAHERVRRGGDRGSTGDTCMTASVITVLTRRGTRPPRRRRQPAPSASRCP